MLGFAAIALLSLLYVNCSGGLNVLPDPGPVTGNTDTSASASGANQTPDGPPANSGAGTTPSSTGGGTTPPSTGGGTTLPSSGSGPVVSLIAGTVQTGQILTLTGQDLVKEDQTDWDTMFKNNHTSGFEGTNLVSDGYGTGGCPQYTTAVKLMGTKSVLMHDQGEHIRLSDGSGLGGCSYQWPVAASKTGTTWTDVFLRVYSRWNNFLDNDSLQSPVWPNRDMKFWWIAGGSNFAFFNTIWDDRSVSTGLGVYATGSNSTSTWAEGTSPTGTFKNNRWYLIEAHFRMQGSGNYVIQEWIDNKKVLDVTATAGPSPNPGGWGWESNTNWFDTPPRWYSDHWQDGFVVSKSRVGPASLIEVGNSSDYATAVKQYQEPLYLSDGSVQIRLDLNGLGGGPYYMWVTNSMGQRSSAMRLGQ